MQEVRKYSEGEFIAKFSPASVKKEFGEIRTTKQAIEATSESMALCKKHNGEQNLIDVLTLYLIEMSQLINVNQPLSTPQIKELAREIISTYYQMSIVEVAFVLQRGRKGEFGKVGSYALNLEDVMNWFHSYQDERCEEFQKVQQKEHAERIRGKVEVDEEGNYMTVFVDEFRSNEEGRKKIFGALKNTLPESPKQKLEKTKKEILEKGIESTLIDNSQNEELLRMQKEAVEKYGK